MNSYETPADMFKAVETESRKSANAEYFKYKKKTDGSYDYAKYYY